MHVYFAGLGGIAIGPLALMSLDLNYQMSGSDQTTSRYTEILADRGIQTGTDQTGSHLRQVHDKKPIDLYVHTSAMPDSHPEIEAARSLGIKTAKRHELINRIIDDNDLKLIAVSGTHGKTTTTAMLVWLFHELGIPAAHLVGTNLTFAPSGQYEQGAQHMIYEADEYDRNMLQFQPFIALLTDIDYDHPDTYPTIHDYQAAFEQFTAQSDHVVRQSETAVDARITLPGQYNRLHATDILQCMKIIAPDQSEQKMVAVLNEFPGSERRFEQLMDNLVTDYAHTPAEIRATLEIAKAKSDGAKIIAVYQPHQNVRQHAVADDYQDCFKDADHLYWLPTYLSREDESQTVLQPKQLIDKLTVKPKTEIADLDDKLVTAIRQHMKDGDLVIVMGAGSVDEWLRQNFLK